VSRPERTWKWWKRDEGLHIAANEQEESEGRISPFDEILHLDHCVHDANAITNFPALANYITEQEQPEMSTLDEAIKQLLAIEGSTGAAVVDYSSGMALAQGGSPGFDLGVAAAGNSNVVSAKLRTMADLSLESEIEDILITLGTQYHLINVLNSSGSKGLFVYLVLDRTYANLALARHKLKNLAKDITI